ncbi:MAG: methionyl-tRNA formyltransferase [Acidobacteria bacterium]|nr:methionyl-tRNA formyltransferase [Acidobacteriota bacterium]
MKLLFCGTPEFAVPTLRRLHAETFDIAAVVTQPDRPKGRGLAPAAPPVKLAAQQLGLPVEQPDKFKGEPGRALLARHQPDAVVIVGYGQLIPADLLRLPRHGWINLHASLLPKYRGAAPVQWALINGETATGVTTFQLDEGLDTGPIFLQREVPIAEDDNALTLSHRLAEVGAELMVETLRRLAAGQLTPEPQDHSRATKAPLLKREHGRLNFSLPARDISNRIRGLVPWPGAFTSFRGTLLHIWHAKPVGPPAGVVQPPAPGTLLVERHALYVACGPEASGNTWLRLEELQPAGRKRLSATDFINGFHVRTGEKLETPA